MEEKIIVVTATYTDTINEELQQGWKVKMIVPFCQPVALAGQYSNSKVGNYGAYVVLEKKLIY